MVIGGAVQGLLTNKSKNVAGVSLFAAHMPGEPCTHIQSFAAATVQK